MELSPTRGAYLRKSRFSFQNRFWMKVGLFLGKIISPIVMGIVFFFVVTPTGLIMKALGKDILALKKNKNNTYWLEKDNSNNNLKNQF